MAGNACGYSGIAVRLIMNWKKGNIHRITFREGTERDYRYTSAFLLYARARVCVCVCVCVCIQGVPGGMCQTSGGCSLC